jgi:ArsR family transcriptional regulator, virulence genes transcriptional regulator
VLSPQKIEIFKMQAEICKTLSDPKRLMIVHELREGELSVGQLGTRLELPQANVSQHLAILRKRGIVDTRREGTTVFYRLASCKIGEACDMVRSVLSEQLSSNQALSQILAGK